MNIEVNFFATLMKYKPPGAGKGFWSMECDEGTTVGDLLNQSGVPVGDVKIIFINGLQSKPEVILKDGDRLGVFPLVGGG